MFKTMPSYPWSYMVPVPVSAPINFQNIETLTPETVLIDHPINLSRQMIPINVGNFQNQSTGAKEEVLDLSKSKRPENKAVNNESVKIDLKSENCSPSEVIKQEPKVFPEEFNASQSSIDFARGSSPCSSKLSKSPSPFGVAAFSRYADSTIDVTNEAGDCRKKRKITRPFKAYSNCPNIFAMYDIPYAESTQSFPLNNEVSYDDFRNKMLEYMKPHYSNPRMGRHPSGDNSPDTNNNSGRDSVYQEKRRKNNAAAKKSRDARRQKEDELAILAAFLQMENRRLKRQNAEYKQENLQFRTVLRQYQNGSSLK